MDATRIGDRLYASTLAPLVLGGTVAPGVAIGGRIPPLLATSAAPTDAALAERVDAARLRRARMVVAIDEAPPMEAADWILGAALHDIFQATNPTFDAPLRRSSAARILDVAGASIAGVPTPVDLRDALARYTWFARALDVRRTDTHVSYWVGSQRFLGRRPPPRLQAWPELRRVHVVRERREVLALEPLAVDRDRLRESMASFLVKTPLTDLATCNREAPEFAWSEATLGLLASPNARKLALRLLAQLPPREVDVALGRATRSALSSALRARAQPVVSLLADRALARVTSEAPDEQRRADPEDNVDALFARGLGAIAARRELAASAYAFAPMERARLAAALASVAVRAAEAAKALASPP